MTVLNMVHKACRGALLSAAPQFQDCNRKSIDLRAEFLDDTIIFLSFSFSANVSILVISGNTVRTCENDHCLGVGVTHGRVFLPARRIKGSRDNRTTSIENPSPVISNESPSGGFEVILGRLSGWPRVMTRDQDSTHAYGQRIDMPPVHPAATVGTRRQCAPSHHNSV
jgi:hypothetical protein